MKVKITREAIEKALGGRLEGSPSTFIPDVLEVEVEDDFSQSNDCFDGDHKEKCRYKGCDCYCHASASKFHDWSPFCTLNCPGPHNKPPKCSVTAKSPKIQAVSVDEDNLESTKIAKSYMDGREDQLKLTHQLIEGAVMEDRERLRQDIEELSVSWLERNSPEVMKQRVLNLLSVENHTEEHE